MKKDDTLKSAGEIAAKKAAEISAVQAAENQESGSETKPLEDPTLRLRADFENTKKRLERDKLEAIKFANERLLSEILPIMDNLDRAMASLTEGHDPAKVKDGLKIAQEELHQVLELHGVQMVKSVGEEFNTQFHEAVGVVEGSDAKDGTILEEVQRGYLLNGRLIRPSRVKIAQNTKEERP